MSLALLESAVNGSSRPCAIAGCERYGAIAEARHHLRAPEWIYLCPAHRATHEAADTCRSPGCPARAVQWGLCGRHQTARRPAPASALAHLGPPTQATAEDRDRILAILRGSPCDLSISDLQRRLPELTRAQLRDALGELERADLALFLEGGWKAAEDDDDLEDDDLEDDPPETPSDTDPDPPAAPAQEPPMADPRLAPSDRRILDLVRARPGVAQAAVAELAGVSQGTVAGCIRLLEGRGLIERRREAPTERPGYLGLALYPAGAPASPTPPAPPPREAAEVRSDALALIRAEPGILQARISERIGVGQSATSRALRALEAEGLIRRERIETPREGGGGTRSLALYPAGAPVASLAPQAPAPGEAPPAPEPPAPEAIPETRLRPLVRVRTPPLPPLPEGEEPGGDCDGPGDPALALDRSEDLERQLRERTAERDAASAARDKALRERSATILEETRERAEILMALGLPASAGLEEVRAKRMALESAAVEDSEDVARELAATRRALNAAEERLSAQLSEIEDAPAPGFEPRWVEREAGSWDLVALRPVVIAEVEADLGGWSWSVPDPDPTLEPVEEGRARSLESARRRAEQAVEEVSCG